MAYLRNFFVIFILIFFNSVVADAQQCQNQTIEQKVCSDQTGIPVCACTPLFGTDPFFTAPNRDGTCGQGCSAALPQAPSEDEDALTYTCLVASYLIKDSLPAACESGCVDRGISQTTAQSAETISGHEKGSGLPLFHVCCAATKTRVCAPPPSPTIFQDGPEEDGPEEDKPGNNKPKPGLFRPGPDDIG